MNTYTSSENLHANDQFEDNFNQNLTFIVRSKEKIKAKMMETAIISGKSKHLHTKSKERVKSPYDPTKFYKKPKISHLLKIPCPSWETDSKETIKNNDNQAILKLPRCDIVKEFIESPRKKEKARYKYYNNFQKISLYETENKIPYERVKTSYHMKRKNKSSDFEEVQMVRSFKSPKKQKLETPLLQKRRLSNKDDELFIEFTKYIQKQKAIFKNKLTDLPSPVKNSPPSPDYHKEDKLWTFNLNPSAASIFIETPYN
ncbi:unnamed protein product [Blepharisma stoltei]|uniref:Uncharacterized protein n=1 Tax=Blepharisma stoltei TaxID=1481888 RepID=A0AAU9JJN0_9CILI|nr:unnamed protein product [Blepharisma stoltei]